MSLWVPNLKVGLTLCIKFLNILLLSRSPFTLYFSKVSAIFFVSLNCRLFLVLSKKLPSSLSVSWEWFLLSSIVSRAFLGKWLWLFLNEINCLWDSSLFLKDGDYNRSSSMFASELLCFSYRVPNPRLFNPFASCRLITLSPRDRADLMDLLSTDSLPCVSWLMKRVIAF